MKNRKKKIYLGDCDISIKEFLNQVQQAGYTEEDYEDLEIRLDYDSCYYESDRPNISIYFKSYID